ncbi:MAG: integrase core domain-containing protein [Verrucomicrobiales bacterium]|nr:integrase core domain-containing protein [Verrucomicrobiales bacterium]
MICHSDRGSQYASSDFAKVLNQAAHPITPSMRRKGNCYDNAFMESFWATRKAECFGSYVPATRGEARLMIFDYIEGFYNNHRLHSMLGYQSPLAFERQLLHNMNH